MQLRGSMARRASGNARLCLLRTWPAPNKRRTVIVEVPELVLMARVKQSSYATVSREQGKTPGGAVILTEVMIKVRMRPCFRSREWGRPEAMIDSANGRWQTVYLWCDQAVRQHTQSCLPELRLRLRPCLLTRNPRESHQPSAISHQPSAIIVRANQGISGIHQGTLYQLHVPTTCT